MATVGIARWTGTRKISVRQFDLPISYYAYFLYGGLSVGQSLNTHTYTHTYIHTHARTHTHAHAHTYTQISEILESISE